MLSPTNYTQRLSDVKDEICNMFSIPSKEEAMRIIYNMERILKDQSKWPALKDEQDSLLEILRNVPEYVRDHSERTPGGEIFVTKILSSYRDGKANRKAVAEYRKYVTNMNFGLNAIKEYDKLFFDKMSEIVSEYKSSTDYMTRLVRRLMKYNLGHSDEIPEDETTRVLILRQFIKEFGYSGIPDLFCPRLKDEVNSAFGGDINKIDDSVFRLLNAPSVIFEKNETEENQEFTDTEKEELKKAEESEESCEDDTVSKKEVAYNTSYIKAITNLQGTIKLKAPLICVTKEITEMLCDIMDKNVLSEDATNGTALLLSDCFIKPLHNIVLDDFKDFGNLNIDKIEKFTSNLRKRYQNGGLLHTDFTYEERLFTIMKKYSDLFEIKKCRTTDKLILYFYGDIAKPNRALDFSFKISDKFPKEKIYLINASEYPSESYKENIKKLTEKLERLLFKTHPKAKDDYCFVIAYALKEYGIKEKAVKIDYSFYHPLFRLIVIAEKYSYLLSDYGKTPSLLRKILPDFRLPEKLTGKFVKEEIWNEIKSLPMETACDKESFIRELVEHLENYIEDKKAYAQFIRIKVENRFNNTSTVGATDYDANQKKLFLQIHKKSYNYRLLTVADSLASADFSLHDKTREYLYLFAIAFHMYEKKGEKNRITDIEKNLFSDYYCDNLVNNTNVIIDGYGINRSNPGEIAFLWALNQKNLTAKEKAVAAYRVIDYCKEKGKTKEEFYQSNQNEITEDTLTGFYNNIFGNLGDLSAVSEERIKNFLIDNYPCKPENEGIMQINRDQKTAAKIINKKENQLYFLLRISEKLMFENTAESELLHEELQNGTYFSFFNEYHYQRSRRCNNCAKKSDTPFPYCEKYFESYTYQDKEGNTVVLKPCNEYFLDFLDYQVDNGQIFFEKIFSEKYDLDNKIWHFEKNLGNITKLCPTENKNLEELLIKINKRLINETASLRKSDATDYKSQKIHLKEVSRSTIIALCLYEIFLINRLIINSDEATIFGNFRDFYTAFCDGFEYDLKIDDKKIHSLSIGKKTYETVYSGVNKLLESAGYQPVSHKNIFDVYSIFIAYRDNYAPVYRPQNEKIMDFYKNAQEEFRKLEKESEKKKEKEKNKGYISKDI